MNGDQATHAIVLIDCAFHSTTDARMFFHGRTLVRSHNAPVGYTVTKLPKARSRFYVVDPRA